MAYLESLKYGDMIHGTDENDILVAGTSYVSINGDAGDDLLVVSTDPLGKNIANVTMTGGDGADTFGFLPREQKIFSAIITDFNAADGDVVIIASESGSVLADEVSDVSLGAVVGVERIDNESIRRLVQDDAVTEEEISLRALADSNVTGDFLRYITDSDGDVTSAFLHLSRNDDTLGSTFIFQGITDIDAFENADLIYADYNGLEMNRTRLGELQMPNGLSMTYNGRSGSDYNWLYISSEYEGDLWLDGIDYKGDAVESWTSGSITNINARNDTVGGRMLAGNANDNYIYASDYGNSIWGGGGDQNWLYGGAGADTFIAAVEYSGGYNRIRDFGDEDIVYIDSISSEDIFSEFPSVYLESFSSGVFYEYKWNIQAIRFLGTADDSTVIIIAYNSRDSSDVNKVFRVNVASDTSKVTLQLSDGYRLQFNYDNIYEWHVYEDDVWIPIAIKKGGLETFTADNGDEGLYVYHSYYGSLILDNWTYFNSIKIVDARNDDRAARVLTGNANDNTIYANQYGSYLWGGTGGNDLLIGGSGDDTFVANGDGDNDTLVGCSNYDLIILEDIALGDISAVEAITNSDGVETSLTVTTRNGSEIKILSSDTAKSTTVRLGDYSAWQYNYTASTWTNIREPLPYGLTGDGNTVIVSSDYEGDLWVGGTDFDGNAVESWSSESVRGIDASDDMVSGRMLAGNANSNYIYAGSGGASLWGGEGGSDELYGGAGADTFITGKGEGNTDIYDCEDNDLVYLWNITRDDIADCNFNSGSYYDYIEITTFDNNLIRIRYNKDTTTATTIKYADDEVRTFDHARGNWQSLFVDTDTALQSGFIELGRTIYVSSEYEGDIYIGGTDLNGNPVEGWSDGTLRVIDARNDTVGGRMLAGNNQTNTILAGNGGASLWGGDGWNNYLYGGAGADTFIAGKNEGSANIYNCSDDDLVYLWDIGLDDIASVSSDEDGGVLIRRKDGTYISVSYDPKTTSKTTIQYANGERRTFDHASGDWRALFIDTDTTLPSGLSKIGNSVYVSSEYSGDVSLETIDGSISNIDASDDTIGGRLLAGNSNENYIYAGSGGASLWGGNGGSSWDSDYLYGGAGADTFIAEQGGGRKYIYECEDNDIVVLRNINPEDIASASASFDDWFDGDVIRMNTKDGTYISIQSNPMTTKSTTIQYANGDTRTFDHGSDNWRVLFADIDASLPDGMLKLGNAVYVSSEYEGNVLLPDLNNSSIIRIDAREDTVGNRMLVGDAQSNTIYAGSGGASLWGGIGGNDSLVGGSGADTFFAGNAEGNVYIRDCADGDIVSLHNINPDDIASESVSSDYSGSIKITTNDGMQIDIQYDTETTKTTTIQYANGEKKIYTHLDETTPNGLLHYDKNLYVSSEYADALWLGGVDLNGNTVEGWSDSTVTDIRYNYNDTRSNRMLAGNANDNYIRANNYGNSLWGGNGGDDWLSGGDGADTFIAGQGEGNTRIYYCEDNDIVVLHNINLTDISNVSLYQGYSSNTIYITTTDGTKIDINYNTTATKTTIQYADGTTRTFDHASGNWRALFAEDVTLPDGLIKLGEMLYVSSEYEGIVSLPALNNDSIKNIDASEDTVGSRILIGDAQDNSISAGSSGASLWGGNGGWDYLMGGAGADTFVAGQGEGDIIIDGCSDDDRVLLHNINPEDIMGEFLYEGFSGYHSIDLTTAENTTINIRYKNQTTSETTIQYADGSTKVYNHIDSTGLPEGIRRYDNSIYVSSDYEGDIWLGGVDFNGNTVEGWSDSTVRYIFCSANVNSDVMLAGNSNNNIISAGNGGMSLWGGNGGNDIFWGGEGADTFIAGAGEGNTDISYYKADDLVFLWNVNLDDIAGWSLTADSYSPNLVMTTTDGTEIEINTYDNTVLTTTVQYADGSRQQFNYSTRTWSSV